MVNNLPAVWKTQLQSLGWEDPLEGMATHSSILAWRIPRTEEPGGLQSMGSQRVGDSWATKHLSRAAGSSNSTGTQWATVGRAWETWALEALRSSSRHVGKGGESWARPLRYLSCDFNSGKWRWPCVSYLACKGNCGEYTSKVRSAIYM